MNLKKLAFSDHYMSSTRNKLVSRFGLGIMVSFVVLSVVFCNFSFKVPIFGGFSGSNSSSVLSWPFSSGVGDSLGNDTSLVNELDHPVGVIEPLQASVDEKSNKTSEIVDLDGKNVTDKIIGEGINVGEPGFGAETGEGNVSLANNSTGVIGAGTGEGNVSLGNHSSVSVGAKGNGTELENMGVVYVKNETVVVQGNGTVRNVAGGIGGLGFQGIMEVNAKKSFDECDIYHGEWVRDDTKPYYPPSSCPFIDKDFDCHLNGRPDSEYVKWRWQPYDCDIPRLNTTDFLERLRGKKLVFVGDSLNRNMWESLVCVLRHGVADKKRVYEISGRHEFKKKGFYAFLFEDYNCTIDFVSSPFLVQESTYKSKNGSLDTLRLDLMDKTTSMYHDADVIIFNTGHWWTHEKTSRGEDYYQEGNYVHPRLKVLKAYTKALATWGRWVDKNIDKERTHVIFRGYSVTHFRGGPWNSGGQCHKETEPIFNQTYLAKYPTKMKILEYVLKDMKTPVTYLNISRLTDYRKDGHPSLYRPNYQAAQQELHAQDCSHWCLPGVPDTWNHLLYVSLLKSRLGS